MRTSPRDIVMPSAFSTIAVYSQPALPVYHVQPLSPRLPSAE